MNSVQEKLHALLGDAGYLTDATAMAPYLREWRGKYHSTACAVVLPRNTAQVAQIVRLCQAHHIGIVPQGGNTGLVGGSVAQPEQIILNLSRMQHIRAVDVANNTITVEAGCVLADMQQAAAAAGRYFPLDFASAQQCQIGGNLATNAGGINVLKYDNARDLCLGLEAVLPNGDITSNLNGLRKDNTGYDLRHLLIGSEGTLGIITAATFKLFPAPQTIATGLIALDTPQQALDLLNALQTASGNAVSSCELIPDFALQLVLAHSNHPAPFAERYPWYVLIELTSAQPDAGLDKVLQQTLQRCTYRAANVAKNAAEAADLWALRKAIPGAQKHAGGSIKHDIAVPVAQIPRFIATAIAAVKRTMPDARVCAFGHLGDGNLHFNISQPAGADTDEFLAQWERINTVVHDVVAEFGGSISAEHGIGLLKKDELARYKNAASLQAMRAIKAALDPAGIMNPGKIF